MIAEAPTTVACEPNGGATVVAIGVAGGEIYRFIFTRDELQLFAHIVGEALR